MQDDDIRPSGKSCGWFVSSFGSGKLFSGVLFISWMFGFTWEPLSNLFGYFTENHRKSNILLKLEFLLHFQGDSGGPLVLHDKIVIGVLSWSSPSCDDNLVPGVYTRITEYMPFIEDVLNWNKSPRIRVATRRTEMKNIMDSRIVYNEDKWRNYVKNQTYQFIRGSKSLSRKGKRAFSMV